MAINSNTPAYGTREPDVGAAVVPVDINSDKSGSNRNSGNARAVVIAGGLNPDGTYSAGGVGAKQESFVLADNKSAAGDYPNGTPSASVFGQAVYGGDYVWTVIGTVGASSSIQLKTVVRNSAGAIIGTQNLGAAKTAADTTGGTGVGLGSNAEIYVTFTGANFTNVSVVISRLP